MRHFGTYFLAYYFSNSPQIRNFAQKSDYMGRKICCLLFALILSACNQDGLITKIETIKAIGDTAPEKGLLMADSLRLLIEDQSEYIQMKYHLLCIRLNDKAYKTATNDILVRKTLPYFKTYGTDAEKQEAYYYAGSVYRDLKDTPRALEYFLKSAESTGNIDSIMLRNTHSQLYSTYFHVQDFKNALLAAKNEYQIANKIGKVDEITSFHLAACYLALDSLSKSKQYCDETYKVISQKSITPFNAETAICLLYTYLRCKNLEKADKIYRLLEQNSNKERSNHEYLTLGEYYLVKNRVNEAISCFESILTQKNKETDRYDTYRQLINIYYQLGDYRKSAEYAKKFVEISDTINLGKRQLETATVNNLHQYHRDREREQLLHEKITQYRIKVYLTISIGGFIALLFWILFNRKHNQHQKKLTKVVEDLQGIRDENKNLEEELRKAHEQLDANKEKFKQAQEEITKTEEDLKFTTIRLREIQQQNDTLKLLYHQNKLNVSSKEVLQNIRRAAVGQYQITQKDWEELYATVDELYPTFQDELINNLGNLDEPQMQVYYMLRIGLTCSTIQNVSQASRSSVYRWANTYRKSIMERTTG